MINESNHSNVDTQLCHVNSSECEISKVIISVWIFAGSPIAIVLNTTVYQCRYDPLYLYSVYFIVKLLCCYWSS